MTATVIGAGFAGCEAAYFLAQRGVKVTLFEQKPKKFSPAHHSPNFCELVCSNSLKAQRINSASGLLKEEMRLLGSLTVPIAYKCSVPAGGALAVDREQFSSAVTAAVKEHKNITVIDGEVTAVPNDDIVIIATGPLTEGDFAKALSALTGEYLSFYDAAAPIVDIKTVDMEHAFAASRYGKGGDDYINCPMNKDEYENFYNEIIGAKRAVLHDFDNIYEACVPIEVLAHKGHDTMRFGPLKPVGLTDPKTGHRPFANLQLRRESAQGDLYNLVGFQTNLTFAEQKRVFSLIPALKNAQYERYGVMHRNSFINSPLLTSKDLSLKEHPNIFIAGQLSGVEGYMESAASGLMCAINAYKKLSGQPPIILPTITMLGGLFNYITTPVKNFQPMGAAFGLVDELDQKIRDKGERYSALAQRSIDYINTIKI